MTEIRYRNSFKFSTVLLIIIGLLLPLWPVSLPFFWWLGYKSYKKGNTDKISFYKIEKAKNLLDSGAINEAEYASIKEKLVP